MRASLFKSWAAAVLCAFAANPALAQPNPPSADRARLLRSAEVAVTEIVPPSDIAPPSEAASSIALRAGPASAGLQRLNVKRRLSLQRLRANPVIALRDGTADLRPMLDNPAALSNLASRLKAQPALARVSADRLEVLEIDQGLIVQQYLSYRLSPGACSDPRKRAEIRRIGADCFDRLSMSQRGAAFADPRDPHYVADPGARAKALADAAKAESLARADIAAGIDEWRAKLRDPAERAAIEREIGAAETARIAALDDAALEGELVNSAEIEMEETMFVPGQEAAADPLRLTSGLALMSGARFAPEPRTVNATYGITDQIYLTGFTLGREHEWRKRVSISIKWCVFGCKKTYFAEVYAGFNYGFGLRFPVRMGGAYHYESANGRESATFTPAFTMINGTEADYRAAGLPGGQVFGGKELVAELGGYAGFAYRVPFYPGARLEIRPPQLDLTSHLPAPYTNGQFTPPTPGRPVPSATKTLEAIDLIGGRANFGIVGGKVMPAVKLDLNSDKLEFRLKDNVSGKQQSITASGKAYPLAIDPRDKSSRFSIGDPVYNLSFNITPGVVGRLFVDVSVWSHKWDWPVWFPKLTISLPPGGADFSCHAGTICARSYHFSPTFAREGEAASSDPMERLAVQWTEEFDLFWKDQCPDETGLQLCRTAIGATTQTYRNRMIAEMKGKPPVEARQLFEKLKKEAIGKAGDIVTESFHRASRR